MNGRTAKAIRRFATKLGVPYRTAKERWLKTPAPQRAEYRRQINEEIRDFAWRLKRWRGHRTQKDAAAKLNVPFDTYRNWEYGVNMPSDVAMRELERHLYDGWGYE